MKNKFLYLLLVATYLVSCTEQVSKKVLKPLSFKVISDISEIVDTIEIVELEPNSNSYISEVLKLIETRDGQYIVKDISKITVFDSKGRFVKNIGKFGQGPGEFSYVNDIALNSGQDAVLVLDAFNQVYSYALADGSFLGKIKYEGARNKNYDAIAPSSGRDLFLSATNPLNSKNSFDNSFYCLDLYSSDGKLKSSFLCQNDFLFNPNRITRSYDGSYFVRPLEGTQILYRIENGSLREDYIIDFEGKNIPVQHIFSFGNNPWEHIQDYIKSPYFKLPMGFLETKEYLYFYCSGDDGATHEFLFNKKTFKGVRWKNDGETQLRLYSSDCEYFKTITFWSNKEIGEKSNDTNPMLLLVSKFLPKSHFMDEDQLLLKIRLKIE